MKSKDGSNIGYVEWIKNAEYGMVYDLENHEKFFFHVNMNPLINHLEKDSYVIFDTYFDNRKKQQCAKDVLSIDIIEDLNLLNGLVDRFEHPYENQIDKKPGTFGGFNSPDIEKIVRQVKKQIEVIEYFSDERLMEIQSNDNLIENYINNDNFKLIKQEKVVKYFHDYVQKNVVELIKTNSILLSFFNDENGCKLFDKIIYETECIDTEESYEFALDIIKKSLQIGPKICQKITDHFVKVASSLFKLKFWIKGNFQGDITPDLTAEFVTVDNEFLDQIKWKLESEGRPELLETILDSQLAGIDFISSLDFERKWSIRIELLEEEKQQYYIDQVFEKTDEITKLNLWTSEKTEKFDFDSFKIAVVTLDKKEQESFIKRLFRYAEKEKIDLNIQMLKDIQLFDRQLSIEFGIDYTLDIILSAIIQLAEGEVLSDKSIIDVLAYHIDRNAYGRFQLSGYFNLCEGRAFVHKEPDKEGKEVVTIVRSKNTPSGVVYCEGRKSPNLDRSHQKPFWWCRNSMCFEPCRSDHGNEDWKNYTLKDFLRILKIPIEDEMYGSFLGWINRINTLLSRLNCRGCKKILKPKNQANYSFYRVNSFICDNNDCNHKETVYLNHCLNGKCQHLIDSRDSVKCENGMFICSNPKCGDCCSTEVFAKRINNLKINGRPVPDRIQYIVDHDLGHKGKVSFCFKCGSEMNGGWGKYDEIKDWLISKKDNKAIILKSGIRDTDKRHWFLTSFPEEKYKLLSMLGFQVKLNENGTRLVSEPFGKMEDPPKYCENPDCDNSQYELASVTNE